MACARYPTAYSPAGLGVRRGLRLALARMPGRLDLTAGIRVEASMVPQPGGSGRLPLGRLNQSRPEFI
jgi:hypothetical protein